MRYLLLLQKIHRQHKLLQHFQSCFRWEFVPGDAAQMLCETRPLEKLNDKVDFVEGVNRLVQLHDESSLVALALPLLYFPQYFYFSC